MYYFMVFRSTYKKNRESMSQYQTRKHWYISLESNDFNVSEPVHFCVYFFTTASPSDVICWKFHHITNWKIESLQREQAINKHTLFTALFMCVRFVIISKRLHPIADCFQLITTRHTATCETNETVSVTFNTLFSKTIR